MTYKSLHTLQGLTKIAQFEATGTPITITHIAVGDGNGNDVTPNELMTGLVRERYRGVIERTYQDSVDTTQYLAELVIPASVGGFVMREVSVICDDGTAFTVGNMPTTVKPEEEEGAFSDTIVRVVFKSGNATIVVITVDPNVATASRSWVLNNINSAHVIPGGTTGQIATKASNADGDIEWADPGEVNVVVDVIEERQTLVATQTVVTLATVTTRSLAVYVDGGEKRLTRGPGVDQWEPDPSDPDTQIILGQDWPGLAIFVQNDPLGGVEFPLAREQNLADVPDKAAARANLGVYSKAEVRDMVPPGIVDHYAAETPPPGWFVRDGSAVSRTAYPELFAKIGIRFGAGDGFTSFNLPDDRELFDRGWGGSTSGRALGSYQADEFKSHTHPLPTTGTYQGNGTGYDDGGGNSPGFPFSSAAAGGTETRPKNRAYLPIIKF